MYFVHTEVSIMAFTRSSFTKEYYAPREVAVYVGVSSRTIMRYCREGYIKEERTPTDRRRIPREAVLDYLEQKGLLIDDNEIRRDVIYARVSTIAQANRGDLDRQVQDVLMYAVMRDPKNLEVIKEIGSGLNDNRKQLCKLLNAVMNREINRIFINYKDRLTRFGYNYLELICSYAGTEIVIVSNETEAKSVQEELAEDLIAIIHSFSGKLYGLRRKDRKKIQEDIEAINESE